MVDAVRAKLDVRCLARKISKAGCALQLKDVPAQRIAIDLDSRFAPGKNTGTRCDYLFLAEDDDSAFAIPIELKRGGFKATGVVAQLQAGADVLASLLPEHSYVLFRPIVASGRFPKAQRDDFQRAEVRFRGTNHRLVHATCGRQLLSALPS